MRWLRAHVLPRNLIRQILSGGWVVSLMQPAFPDNPLGEVAATCGREDPCA